MRFSLNRGLLYRTNMISSCRTSNYKLTFNRSFTAAYCGRPCLIQSNRDILFATPPYICSDKKLEIFINERSVIGLVIHTRYRYPYTQIICSYVNFIVLFNISTCCVLNKLIFKTSFCTYIAFVMVVPNGSYF